MEGFCYLFGIFLIEYFEFKGEFLFLYRMVYIFCDEFGDVVEILFYFLVESCFVFLVGFGEGFYEFVFCYWYFGIFMEDVVVLLFCVVEFCFVYGFFIFY